MSGDMAPNVHATAIVTGTTGLLFIGPSGSGKSSLAFSCMTAARRAGLYAALVADDQVLLGITGGHVVARRPDAIAGLMEFRATGIGAVDSIPHALMHCAIRIVDPRQDDRLPPEGERFDVAEATGLPLLRLPATATDPLAVLAVFIPALARQMTGIAG